MRIAFISAAAAFCFCANLVQLHAQATSSISATIRFNNGQVLTISDFSDPIGIGSGETVAVTVQLPSGAAAEEANVAPLDGGEVTASSASVAEDGSLQFQFQAAKNPGENRVSVQHGRQTLRLRFWVINAANPQNNPPLITPANQEG